MATTELPRPFAARERCAVSSLHCRVYRVPTDRLEADGTLQWSDTTVVVVEVGAADSLGLGWTYASAGCRAVVERELREAVIGISALDVPRAHEAMVRSCRNLGRPGVVGTAISAVDIAIWDLKAHILGVSLSDLLGRCRDDVPLYGSGGFTTYDNYTMSRQLEQWVDGWGIPRVKIKIGESWGTAVERDLARVALCREVVGDQVEVYVDANGAYQQKQAVRVGQRLEGDYRVVWFEEPVSSDDLTGLHHVRERLGLDIAAGEYGYDESYFDHMLRAEAVDCLQADATRCGGYTSWLRIAALAGAHGLQISGHCAPNLHAAVATSVPNLRHVEYFHDHSRLDAILFEGMPAPRDGRLIPVAESPGHGMTLRSGVEALEVG